MKLLLKITALILVAALVGGAWFVTDYLRFLKTPLSLGMQPVTIVVKSGSNLSGLAKQLENNTILLNRHYLLLYARFQGNAHQIRAGEYELVPGMMPSDLLKIVTDGKVVQHSFTVIEGWTFKQLMEAIRSSHFIVNDFDGLTDEQITSQLSIEVFPPEGLFLPETYFFPRGTRASQILKRAQSAMDAELDKLWKHRSANIAVSTPYEALILASIIEKETAAEFERDEIAGVFTRRLQKRMRLQTDPTVIYGMGSRYQGTIRTRDLREATEYNTYVISGLPPTPIALPGRESIHAALNPKPGRTLYFVSKGDGTHHFSETLEEHNRAVTQYILKR